MQQTHALSRQRAVLVVDDDPAILGSLKFSLEIEGYAVRTYPTARSLLADTEPKGRACVVIDYNLPEGDAFSVLADLRAHGVDGPAIIITTNPGPQLRRRADAAGIPIVEKPLFGNALIEALGAAFSV